MGKELVLHEETKQYPRREENPWRPSPLLCKRFDLLDPFAGKVIRIFKSNEMCILLVRLSFNCPLVLTHCYSVAVFWSHLSEFVESSIKYEAHFGPPLVCFSKFY